MYDVNNHPMQDRLNKELGILLGKTIKRNTRLSDLAL